MTRVIAIDWSGAKTGERSKIWLAEVRDGEMTRLESGRSRAEVIRHVVEEAERDPHLVVGFDFAFSLPRWFLDERGIFEVDALWNMVARDGEEWLRRCEPPFWGRPGKPKPSLPAHLRTTEKLASVAGIGAKSCFQIGGAGAVGTGSLRGMPYLAVLRQAGFAVWPFHEARLPLVIEIYPRLLTGPVTKSSHPDRERYLSGGFHEIGEVHLRDAASSEDAFDAAVSAVMLSRHRNEILKLERTTDPTGLLEGLIWSPVGAPLSWTDGRVFAKEPGCPFCEPRADQVVAETNDAVAIRDRYPLSRGHTLILPRAHGERLFAHPTSVQQQVWRLVSQVRAALEKELTPDGFTIGVNDGLAAGQTVSHAHVHVIPRFHGDVPDPRGGLRWVLPERAPYWQG